MCAADDSVCEAAAETLAASRRLRDGRLTPGMQAQSPLPNTL